MKKMRKILSLALAVIMMMAMSVTAFAADTAKITINNLGKDVILTYEQVIVADTSTSTGWEIADGFVSAFQKLPNMSAETDTQKLIEAYIGASESDRAKALANVATNKTFTNGMEVTSAGLYVVNASDTTDETKIAAGAETGYTYQTMAVYVGMDYTNGAATGISSQPINAKKEETTVNKTVDKLYVEFEEQLTYTVNTTVPYIAAGQTLSVPFAVTDKISGAVYNVDATTNKLNVIVESAEGTKNIPVEVNNNSFTVDLSYLVDADNTYANTAVTLTYTATAKSLQIFNTAYPTIADHVYDDNYDTEKSFSGQISITKYDKDKKNTLKGAEFVIKNAAGKYAKLDENNQLIGWEDKEKDGSKIVTGDDGVATAYGFDADLTYTFVEVTAPTGYSVSNTTVDVTWDAVPNTPAVRIGTAELIDTPLSQLPFTGGMGTTIFTVLGVAIMAIAAALFFASKKKASK